MDMKKQINDLLLKMQTGENCIGETANLLLDLFAVNVSAAVEEILKPKYMNDVYIWKQVRDAIIKVTDQIDNLQNNQKSDATKFRKMELINIADLKNPETGKTLKEENNSLQHKYKVNDLVEVIGWGDECEYTGMRLYIIGCTRDCDGTPLYVLGSKGMELYQTGFGLKENLCYNFNSFSGFGEDSLKLVVSA